MRTTRRCTSPRPSLFINYGRRLEDLYPTLIWSDKLQLVMLGIQSRPTPSALLAFISFYFFYFRSFHFRFTLCHAIFHWQALHSSTVGDSHDEYTAFRDRHCHASRTSDGHPAASLRTGHPVPRRPGRTKTDDSSAERLGAQADGALAGPRCTSCKVLRH